MTGYSDRINHALAFAAKHHDQQVRRGTKAPYSTQPANVAVMLTRYGCDDDLVVAGILLDVVEDYSRESQPADLLRHRIGDKFGSRALELALAATERRVNDAGLELGPDERRQDLYERLGQSSAEARTLAAARALHAAGTLLADLARTVDVESVWSRLPGGRTRTLETYRRLLDHLSASGDRGEVLDELRATIDALDGVPAQA